MVTKKEFILLIQEAEYLIEKWKFDGKELMTKKLYKSWLPHLGHIDNLNNTLHKRTRSKSQIENWQIFRNNTVIKRFYSPIPNNKKLIPMA